jgi:hypothetical protein
MFGRTQDTDSAVAPCTLSQRHYLDFLGADDGIRTRDPHLGKVILFVQGVHPSPMDCVSVQPVSTESASDPACCRAVYYEPLCSNSSQSAGPPFRDTLLTFPDYNATVTSTL